MSRTTAGRAPYRDGVMLHAEQIGDLIALLGRLGDWLAHAGPAVRTELSTFVPTPAFASPTPVPAEQVLAELQGHTETLIRGLHAHRSYDPWRTASVLVVDLLPMPRLCRAARQCGSRSRWGRRSLLVRGSRSSA